MCQISGFIYIPKKSYLGVIRMIITVSRAYFTLPQKIFNAHENKEKFKAYISHDLRKIFIQLRTKIYSSIFLKPYSSVIRQKDGSQNGSYKKT